jgi:hypothetical protein
MRFGKYRGQALSEIPSSYLRWCLRELEHLSDDLHDAMAAELDSRDSYGPIRHPPSGPPVDWPCIVRKWHSEMALQFHPDRGGSVEVMQAINHAADRLRELVGI